MNYRNAVARLGYHLRATKKNKRPKTELWPHEDLSQQGEIRPHMTTDEEKYYEFLLSASNTLVEYGVGGSTLMALNQQSVATLISVESDRAWADQMLGVSVVANAVARDVAKIIHVDIGTVGAWGKPIGHDKIDQWPKYAAAPWEHIDCADLVFVDGQFRVACIMESVLRAQYHTLIAVHDFWNRPQYHVVLPFLEWHHSCDTLGVFRARRDINRGEALFLLEAAQLISD